MIGKRIDGAASAIEDVAASVDRLNERMDQLRSTIAAAVILMFLLFLALAGRMPNR